MRGRGRAVFNLTIVLCCCLFVFLSVCGRVGVMCACVAPACVHRQRQAIKLLPKFASILSPQRVWQAVQQVLCVRAVCFRKGQAEKSSGSMRRNSTYTFVLESHPRTHSGARMAGTVSKCCSRYSMACAPEVEQHKFRHMDAAAEAPDAALYAD